jgi:hypothetical protein
MDRFSLQSALSGALALSLDSLRFIVFLKFVHGLNQI